MPTLSPITTGPGRPRDPAKHKAILEAAKRLFMRDGYDGCSMDAIAAEAGVSKLTVYNHFKDKETLYSTAVQAKCDEQLPQLLAGTHADVPLAEQLLSIARSFHTLVNSQESIEMHRLMINAGPTNPGLSQLFYDAGPQRVLAQMEALLADAAKRGLLRIDNPEQAADQFFCLIKGCAHFRLLIGIAPPLDAQSAERHVRNTVEFFLRAYQP